VLAHAAHGDQRRIHTVARDGSRDAVLDTGRDPLDRVSEYSPAWSPDGGQIAFLALRVEATGYRTFAFIVGAEGGAPRLQVAEESAMEALAWSPDGERLAVLAGSSGVGEILVVNRDGSGLARLSPGEQDGMPIWSPDGAQLAFTSIRDGNQELYVMNADGSGVRRLTDHPGLDQAPVWSPDGARLAFQSDRDGDWEIYIIGADGIGLTNLTRSPAEETQPKWR
jgi:Tol biopolymer transport system component